MNKQTIKNILKAGDSYRFICRLVHAPGSTQHAKDSSDPVTSLCFGLYALYSSFWLRGKQEAAPRPPHSLTSGSPAQASDVAVTRISHFKKQKLPKQRFLGSRESKFPLEMRMGMLCIICSLFKAGQQHSL